MKIKIIRYIWEALTHQLDTNKQQAYLAGILFLNRLFLIFDIFDILIT